MNLAEIILENERKKEVKKNDNLVRIKLKELVFTYTSEVIRVLHSTGVMTSTVLPASVIYAIVIKNLSKNSELRETIAKMLLEMGDYVSATGQTWGLIGGALSAVGSVLSGISRSQTVSPDQQALILERERMQRELEQEKAKRKRTTILIVGVSIVFVIGAVIAFKTFGSKPKNQVA